jgi:cardiolipin synthase
MSQNINQEMLIFEGKDYEEQLVNLIQQAQYEILITCYILENEKFGEKILNLLLGKSKQGVKVRLVVDGFGSWDWIDKILPRIKQENFEVRLFHPLNWRVLGWNIKRTFMRFNRRNHQKLFVFDKRIGLIGSRNINNEAIQWRETSIEIIGPSVITLISLFDIIWQRSHDRFFKRYFPLIRREVASKVSDSKHIFSNHTRTLRKKVQIATLQKILNSKEEIFITTPYFFPTSKVMKALLRKGEDGVKISVLLPKHSDVLISKWVSQYHYERLLKANVEIFEYNPSMLHAKSMVIDRWALIGSSNFNRRSVFRDLELDYSADNEGTVRGLIDQFQKDAANSTKIHHVPHMGLMQKCFIMFITRFFSSWL